MEIEVKVPKNYDLLASVHSWIFPGIQPVPEVTFEGGLRRVYTIQGTPTGLTLLQEKPGKTIRILYDNERVTKDEILAKVRQTLNLGFNMKPVLSAMKAVSSLEEIATKIKGVRPYLADTPFEALVKSNQFMGDDGQIFPFLMDKKINYGTQRFLKVSLRLNLFPQLIVLNLFLVEK